MNSKQYKSNGQLYSPASQPGDSLFGDIIHVFVTSFHIPTQLTLHRNGQPWPFLNVEPRKYRFRILDTAISRAFRLYLVDKLSVDEDDTSKHIKFYVVGSDAGRTTKPVLTPDLWTSIAERWEIVVDFAPYAGKSLYLKNYLKVQADDKYDHTDEVMKFNVGTVVTDNSNNGPLPAAFEPFPNLPPGKDLDKPDHIFEFERK